MPLNAPRYVRLAIIAVIYVVVFACAYVGSFYLRFDFDIPPDQFVLLNVTFPVAIAIKLLVFYAFGLYSGWWRYVSLKDLLSVTKASVASLLILLAVNFLFLEIRNFPRSIYVIDLMLTIAAISAVRVSIRVFREYRTGLGAGDGVDRKRLLIIGAGDTGEMLLREIRKNRNLPFEPVGLLDDDRKKHGVVIHGVTVLGPVSETRNVVGSKDVEEIIIAAPSASRAETRAMFEECQAAGIRPKILPAMESVLAGNVSLNAIREVAIDDLLGRKEVHLDQEAIGAHIKGKTVLVTGAGGSIGSEICRQACKFHPGRLVLLEQAENPLFFIERELSAKYGAAIDIVPVVANVCNAQRLEEVFAIHRPSVVLHAAAHKHVPLMEHNPGEAVRNNIYGTRNLVRVADATGVASFVMISTDKAVNPTSVMGCSKRAAELYVQAAAATSNTKFISVRFGNVLGSNGSVVPIFQEQIRNGGPVTVTHPDMQRYFMTIPEATQLVLQAATSGASGEVFVLDMGEPVKIVDLAQDLIRLCGLVPGDDIEIVFTGMRPGEKLFEELSLDAEALGKTSHDKIFIGSVTRLPLDEMEGLLSQFEDIDMAVGDHVRRILKSIVAEYEYKDGGSKPTPAETAEDEDDHDGPYSDRIVVLG